MKYLLILALAFSSLFSESQFKVAIDIGHSISDPGCISSRGVTEYEFNKRMGYELYNILNNIGIYTFVVNPSGANIPLWKRSKLAEDNGADILLSIHHDNVREEHKKSWEYNGKDCKYCDTHQGYGLYISSKNSRYTESKILAAMIGQSMRNNNMRPNSINSKSNGDTLRRLLDREIAMYNYKDLIVLKSSDIPSVLIENGVLSHRKEEQNLNDESYRLNIIKSIAQGILAYQESGEKPSL